MAGLDLAAEFDRRGPWITKFAVAGHEYGGFFDALNDARVAQFFAAFPDARTILELGSLEGGHTVALARRAGVRRVVGVEGRPANLARARFVRDLFGAANAAFVEGNLEEIDLGRLGRFDAVYCCGLLYHLPRPWELLDRVARVSDRLFLSTHYALADEASVTVRGLRGRMYREYGFDDPLSGLSPESFWPTLDSLDVMLRDAGFTSIDVVSDDPAFANGPVVGLAATAGRRRLRRVAARLPARLGRRR